MQIHGTSEREKQNCSILEPKPACCGKRRLSQEQSKSFHRSANSGRGGRIGAALSAFDLCGNFVAVASEAKPSRLIFRLFGGFACIHTRRFSKPWTSCWLKEHRLLPPVCPSLGLLVPLIGRYNLPNFITYRKQIMTNNTQSFAPLIADLVFHWNCA